jgi:hypothetical protein
LASYCEYWRPNRDARYGVARSAPDRLVIDQENVILIGPEALAEHVVDLGLTSWIMDKVG